MKKVTNILIVAIFFLFFLLYHNQVLAKTSITMKADLENKIIKKEDEVTVNLSLQDFQEIGDGINAYILMFEFNTEQLDFVKVQGQNGWNTPVYNQNTLDTGKMKMAATRSTFIKENGEILKVTLKAKQNFTENSMPDIKIKNISFATKINGKILKTELSDEIELQKIESPKKQLTIDDKKEENNDEKSKTEAKTILPKTGSSRLQVLICFIVLSTFVFGFQYKRLNKYLK